MFLGSIVLWLKVNNCCPNCCEKVKNLLHQLTIKTLRKGVKFNKHLEKLVLVTNAY